MELLSSDYRHRRGGFPDLFLWTRRRLADGTWYAACKFLEVKSTNDRLSKKQQVRRTTFNDHVIDARIDLAG